VVKAGVVKVPEVGSVPAQPPDAMHDVAFVDVHVKTDVAPLAIEAELALNVTVGSGATLIIADCVVVPPAPVQAIANVVVLDKAVNASEPEVDWLPVQPPEATQDVALVDVHSKVAELL
jgi:hypothetical protein